MLWAPLSCDLGAIIQARSFRGSRARDKWRGLLRHFSAAPVLPSHPVAGVLCVVARLLAAGATATGIRAVLPPVRWQDRRGGRWAVGIQSSPVQCVV